MTAPSPASLSAENLQLANDRLSLVAAFQRLDASLTLGVRMAQKIAVLMDENAELRATVTGLSNQLLEAEGELEWYRSLPVPKVAS